MKIAVCFSGQPRFVRECYPNIEKFLLEHNKHHQIDVFSHTWFSEEIINKPLYINEYSSFSGDAVIPSDAVDNIKKLYAPKIMNVDVPIIFQPNEFVTKEFIKFAITPTSNFGMPVSEFQQKKTDGLYSMMYSLMNSIISKKTYEMQNNLKYDFVIKMRFDNILISPISFDNLDNRYFYSQEMGKPNFEISDWVNFSNSMNMDLMGTIYLQIDKLINFSVENFGGWSVESIIKSFCIINDIQDKTLPLNTQLPRWGKL
jgi:hypothetical protein